MKSSLKYLLFAMLCFVQWAVFAGEPKIKLTWGQEYEMPKKHIDVGFVGNEKDGFVQIGHRPGKSLSLQHFTSALKLTNENLIDLKSMPKGYMSVSFLSWGEKTYWLFDTWDKKEQKEHLFAQEINVKKGELAGSAKELISCDKVRGSLVVTGYFSFAKANKFKMELSPDSSKLIVHVIYAGEKHDEFEEAGIWAFDNNLTKLWGKDRVKFPYNSKKMYVKDTQSDNDGNLMFLTMVYNDDTRKSMRDDKPNFHYEIIKYSGTEKDAISIKFDFSDKFVSQLVLLQDNKGQTVCAGYYSNMDHLGKIIFDYPGRHRSVGSVDGAFLLRLDNASNKLVNIQKGFYEIPIETFKEYETERTQKKLEKKEEQGKDLAAADLNLRHVIFKDDGSILMLGERYYVVITYTRDSHGNTTTNYHYHYNYILAQYIDPSGKMVYCKKIPKNQEGTNTTFGLGFKLMSYNSSNYVFFMDNPKNMNVSLDEVPHLQGAGGVGTLVAVRLDEAGKMQKAKIFDSKETKEKIDITNADQVGTGTLIGRSWHKKISKICLINII